MLLPPNAPPPFENVSSRKDGCRTVKARPTAAYHAMVMGSHPGLRRSAPSGPTSLAHQRLLNLTRVYGYCTKQLGSDPNFPIFKAYANTTLVRPVVRERDGLRTTI
jgi:hypothetical protein